MPRRVYTYHPGLGWDGVNLISTVGGVMIAASVATFIVNVARSLRAGEVAGDNPWGAGTLEWATTSPPPSYNFAHIPIVRGPEPLWEPDGELPVASGLRTRARELLLTTVVDAEPDLREPSPAPSIWPLVTALTLSALLIGSIFTPWAVVAGIPPVAVALVAWFWPKQEPRGEPVIEEA